MNSRWLLAIPVALAIIFLLVAGMGGLAPHSTPPNARWTSIPIPVEGR